MNWYIVHYGLNTNFSNFTKNPIMRLQFSLSIVLFLVLSHIGFSQDKGNSGNDSIRLHVTTIEKVTRHPLNVVAILNSKGDTIVLSDKKGEAVGRVHKKTKYFSATHSGHKELTFRPKRDPFSNRKIGSVVMTPVDTLQYGDFWKEKKHSVLIAVNELMNIALATRYTHLLNRKEAVGAHLSIYASWIMQGSISKENYNGFKLSVYYQYYLVNNLKGGIYLEPKLSVGYFDANNITYYGGEDETIHYPDKYMSAGAGVSIGFLGYIENSGIFGFSLGAQYFPSGAPRKIDIDNQEYSRIPRDILYSGFPFWETVGPGAIVDFKLFFGFKF